MKLDLSLREDLKQAFLTSVFVIASIGFPSVFRYIREDDEKERANYEIEYVNYYDFNTN